MSGFGLFVGFGAPARGREVQASTVFGEVMAYYASLKASGEIESYEVAILESHGGELGGFILLRGDPERLARIRASAEFSRLIVRGGFAVDHVGVVSALLDAEAARFVGEANGLTADLT
jgi:hypothetical protein